MISHLHRTIFVHIPKCGGQSIETSFLNDLGLSWRTRAPLLLRPNTEPDNGPPFLAHLTAEEYTRHFYVSQELFDSYYTFSVVRNPISRLISIYNYLPIKFNDKKIDFERFIFDWIPGQFRLATQYEEDRHNYPGRFWFVRPQADYVLGADGVQLVKDLFLLDDLSDHFEQIKAKSNLHSDLPHINKSTPVLDSSALRNDHVSFIADIYRRDFELIGRRFGEQSTVLPERVAIK